MRLIDADALKELFPDNGEGSWTYNRTARMYIDNAPTVELQMGRMTNGIIIPIERTTGEWIPVMHRNSFGMLIDCFQCSNCNLYTLPQIKIMITEKLRICPNCGSRMKGTEE